MLSVLNAYAESRQIRTTFPFYVLPPTPLKLVIYGPNRLIRSLSIWPISDHFLFNYISISKFQLKQQNTPHTYLVFFTNWPHRSFPFKNAILKFKTNWTPFFSQLRWYIGLVYHLAGGSANLPATTAMLSCVLKIFFWPRSSQGWSDINGFIFWFWRKRNKRTLIKWVLIKPYCFQLYYNNPPFPLDRVK